MNHKFINALQYTQCKTIISSTEIELPIHIVDYLLVRQALENCIQDVISFKESVTSALDPLPNPPSAAEMEIRWILDELRVTSFYGYNKLIFLANSQILTLAYTNQTFVWFEKAMYHLLGSVERSITSINVSTRPQLQSLLDQMVNLFKQNNQTIKTLLTLT